MKAFILVGGLGTRLRSLGITRPKAMIEIGGRPFLEYLVADLTRQGLLDIVFCVGYGAEQIRRHFGEGRAWGARLAYSLENEPLGTGGALKNAEAHAVEENLVCNGDSFLELDLKTFADFHRQHQALASIAAIPVPVRDDYGALRMAETGQILAFSEKKPGGQGLINGGVYLLNREALEMIPPGRPVSIEHETFPLLVATGRCFGCTTTGFFLDIGTPQRLAQARATLPGFFKINEPR
ncbi:MAG TPA: nucleotidyltransferase family protein [bacterium]|nr:nucleotidyltransferase family protein [bacterium]HPR86581.1 nucleotidyltransferase family protein [bacterium]